LNNLKVSVITVCYNAEKTISRTLKSVLNQKYSNIEYIIIDGASTDSTLDILNSYSNSEFKLISEKDNGLYDAINKGISLCTGDIIGLLHSDDIYPNENIISTVVSYFENDHFLEALSSSVEIYKTADFIKPFRIYNANNFRKWQFKIGIQPPHPGFFIKKEAFNKVGFYRTQYKISGDFEWLLRAIFINKIAVKFVPFTSVFMLDGGLSSSGLKSKVKMNNENLKILKSHGIYSNKILIYLKYLIKVFQIR
jgi:glycosyltransferase involved in cell wall biosynthesis